MYYIFILHQTTTQVGLNKSQTALYYIFILHQTTTSMTCTKIMRRLYYIFILHQTTTACLSLLAAVSVVLYLHSTSNHNSRMDLLYELELYYIFILHQTTTGQACAPMAWQVVLYLHSTSNHNRSVCIPCRAPCCIISSFYIKPQHNLAILFYQFCCIISSFYIKPQHIPLTLLIFSRLKTILGDMKLFYETYLIQSY